MISIAIILGVLFNLSIAGLAFVLGPLVLVAWLVVALCYPVYLRISPGQLDMFRFTPFQKQPTSCDSYDLDNARILVDFKKHLLFVDTNGQTLELSIIFMRNRDTLVSTLFRGAISSYKGPTLPMDSLTS